MLDIQCLPTGLLKVNTYFVRSGTDNDQHYFIVDPGGDIELIVKAIASNKLDAFVITHGHYDHIGALPRLKLLYPNVPVYIHSKDAFYLKSNAWDIHIEDFSKINLSELVKQEQQKESEFPIPELLEANQLLPFAPEWKVLHTPGHSAGSICLYNESEKTLISGDTLFAGGYGHTILKGANIMDMVNSLSTILALPFDTRVLPGHDNETTIGQEQNLIC